MRFVQKQANDINVHYRSNSVKIIEFSDKLKSPVFGPFWVDFSNFGGKNKFPGKSRTTLCGFLALCQSLEKFNDTIQRKRPDRKDERTVRAYFIGPFWPTARVL